MLDDVCYTKNFLSSVIVRIDFSEEVKGLDSLARKVKAQALKYYPIPESRKSSKVEYQISTDQLRKNETEFTEWKFFNRDRTKTLTIIPGAIFLELASYKSYEDLITEYLEIVNCFFGEYKEILCRRLGLRYINEISPGDDNPFGWGDYINPDLLAILKFVDDTKCITRSFHLLELNFGEINLRYQFGLHNPDFPAPIKKKVFIMDFDAYYDGLQEQHEIAGHLYSYHQKIQELFEHSITDKLRELMNG